MLCIYKYVLGVKKTKSCAIVDERLLQTRISRNNISFLINITKKVCLLLLLLFFFSFLADEGKTATRVQHNDRYGNTYNNDSCCDVYVYIIYTNS